MDPTLLLPASDLYLKSQGHHHPGRVGIRRLPDSAGLPQFQTALPRQIQDGLLFFLALDLILDFKIRYKILLFQGA